MFQNATLIKGGEILYKTDIRWKNKVLISKFSKL